MVQIHVGVPIAPAPQQLQAEFCKLLSVGARVRPGAPISNDQDCGVISSISHCDRDGPGANPGFLTNSNGRSSILRRVRSKEVTELDYGPRGTGDVREVASELEEMVHLHCHLDPIALAALRITGARQVSLSIVE